MIKKNLIGQRFGMLEVIDRKRENNRTWCRCECGNLTTATAGDLRKKKSCGCLFEETKEETYKKFAKAHREKNIIEHVNISAINYPKLRANNTSGITGVYWSKRNKRWTAQIWVKGEVISLGSYIHKEDAIKARQEAEDKYYRTFLEEHGIEVKFDKKEKRDL